MEFNDTQNRILISLGNAQTYDYDSTFFIEEEAGLFTYAALKHHTGINKGILQQAMRSLRRDGYVELCTAVDNDGIPHGSGWMITQQGLDAIRPKLVEFVASIPK